MIRHDRNVYRPQGELPDVPVPHLDASPSTLAILHSSSRQHGRQVIVLSSACAGISAAQVRSEIGFVPRERLVRIGTLAHCPVYAHEKLVAMCPYSGLILDVHLSTNGTQVFVTRPESAAEWQQRIFSDCGRRD
jgi:uncharacterized protein (DUF779 family)